MYDVVSDWHPRGGEGELCARAGITTYRDLPSIRDQQTLQSLHPCIQQNKSFLDKGRGTTAPTNELFRTKAFRKTQTLFRAMELHIWTCETAPKAPILRRSYTHPPWDLGKHVESLITGCDLHPRLRMWELPGFE